MYFIPDFKGRDSYVYYLQFDKNVKLINNLDTANFKMILANLLLMPNK